MPIVQIFKDITTVEEGVIIHGCNAQGVMGSGVAKAIKAKWPGAYFAYRNKQFPSGLKLGESIWYEANPNLFIVNGITQFDFGTDGQRYADPIAIKDVICHVLGRVAGTKLQDKVYMPRIGCGLGGLDWDKDVEPHLRFALNSYGGTTWVCDVKPPWEITQYHMHYGKLNNK